MQTHRADEFIPTRESLLLRLRSWNDHDGWSQFFDTYGQLIYSVARKAGLSDSHAQDIVQETIVSVAREMPGFRYDRRIGSFKSWLRQIARRRIADHFRRNSRAIHLDECGGSDTSTASRVSERLADPAGTPFDGIWDAEWEKHIMAAALDRVRCEVSPRQFQIFDFYVLQQMPLATVTKALGISAAQAYLAKHRISRLLKKHVAQLNKETPK